MSLSTEASAPIVLREALEDLQKRLELLRVALVRNGPAGAEAVLALWKETRGLGKDCEDFCQLLERYEAALLGMLWAHAPREYREQVHPELESTGFVAAPVLPRLRPKKILEGTREIFLTCENKALSLPQLVEKLREKGVRFRAREPVKSLGQSMRSSGEFESVERGLYRLKRSHWEARRRNGPTRAA